MDLNLAKSTKGWSTLMLLFAALPVVGFFLLLSVGLVPTPSEIVEVLRSERMMWYFGVLAGCLVAELFFLDFRRTAIYQLLRFDKSVRTDLLVGLWYILGMGALFAAIFALGLPFAVKHVVRSFFGGPVIGFLKFPLVQILFFLLVVDFMRYWLHRIMHEFHFLWEIHKFHHSATSFTIITGNRIHPLESTLDHVGIACVIAITGSPVAVFLTVRLVILFIEKMQHSMVDWRWGWVGKYVLVSPIDHRIHHSPEEEHWDHNYANLFIFWDRLFGSFYTGNRINTEIGVGDNWMNEHGTTYDLIRSMELSGKSLKESLTTREWRR